MVQERPPVGVQGGAAPDEPSPARAIPRPLTPIWPRS